MPFNPQDAEDAENILSVLREFEKYLNIQKEKGKSISGSVCCVVEARLREWGHGGRGWGGMGRVWEGRRSDVIPSSPYLGRFSSNPRTGAE